MGLSKKQNNKRAYPGLGVGKTAHHFNPRKRAAEARNAEFSALTYEQQLESLDERLGKGEGAVKQRKKLAAKIRTAREKTVQSKEPAHVEK